MQLGEKVRLGYAFGASLLSWLVDGPPRPFSATFAVTNRCNLRCSYCSCPLIDRGQLDLDQIAVLFDRLARSGIQRLGLAGGEPAVRTDLPEIIALAKARGFVVTVNSNLTLHHRHPERLADADVLYTSLDGPPDAHEAARGDGAQDGVLAAIADIAPRKPLIAICVVTEHSIGHVDWLLDQAERLGFRMHFQPQCTDTEIVRGSVSPEMTGERLRAFWSSLLDRKRVGRPIVSSTPYLEYLARWDDFTISALLDTGARCAAGRGYFYIDPLGNAFPCAYTKGKTAPVNLLTDDWDVAWNRETPCTRCTVGPMLEFNMLFQRPVAAVRDGLRTYG